MDVSTSLSSIYAFWTMSRKSSYYCGKIKDLLRTTNQPHANQNGSFSAIYFLKKD